VDSQFNKEISKILESYFQASGSLQRKANLYQSNWSSGCEAYANQDYDRAINEFNQGDHSKMMYNAGMAHLCKLEYELAKEAFSRALVKDRFFALGCFQRGYCNYVAGDFPSAFQDFIMAKKLLHENKFIDYGKIGCNFELKKTEILFNLALVHLQLGNLDEATKVINEGKGIHDKGSRVDFDALRAKGACVPFFSQSEIFHPPILASAAKQRGNTNPEKHPVHQVVIKDELAESLRQKIKRLEEGDQNQIYFVLQTLRKAYGEDIMALTKSIPDVTGKEDFLVKQIIELRDILFNRNFPSISYFHFPPDFLLPLSPSSPLFSSPP
jgi:tetratricopeptide (TPR) repeat protein